MVWKSRAVKSQIGSGQAMESPTFWFWAFSTETLLEEGPASKEQHFFMPILRSIAQKVGSLNSGKMTRDHKQRRQTHKVFMARNNQNSDNFTVMLGGCCVQKCLSTFVQNPLHFFAGLRPN